MKPLGFLRHSRFNAKICYGEIIFRFCNVNTVYRVSNVFILQQNQICGINLHYLFNYVLLLHC